VERCIGLDMGYGFIKSDDGREGHVFPSVVGEGSSGAPMALGFRQPPPTEDLRVTVNGKHYFLGDLAIRHSRIAHRGLSPTRSEGDDLRILFLGALSMYCRETMNNFYVVTGLPPGRMHLADDLTRQLRGDHEVIRQTGGQRFGVSIRIDRIEVVPQPVGTYWSEVLDNRGQLRASNPMLKGRIGIIDIGFRTSDLATIVDGEYSPAFSRTVPIGISTGYDTISSSLSTEYGLERETYTLDDSIISGSINVSGQPVDISGLRDQVFEELATKLLVEVRSQWQLAEYDHILITGGGGQVLEKYLRPRMSQALLVNDPVTANARGYFAWAYHNTQQAMASEAPAQQPTGQQPQTPPPAGSEQQPVGSSYGNLDQSPGQQSTPYGGGGQER